MFSPSSVPRDDFWVPDGPVKAIAETNGVIYIGGEFDYISPVSETGGAFDRFSGARRAEFPTFAGAIKAILNDNNGGWFVGGQFTAVGGHALSNLAHITADMNVDTNWTPNPDGVVLSLASDGTNLFVGGVFATIAGETHLRLTALDPRTGSNRPWRADCTTDLINPSVNALVVSGGRLYVGGYFRFINGTEREHIGSVNAANGIVTDWHPNGYTGAEALARVDALAISGNTIYVGGTFNSIGGEQTNGPSRHHIAALDITRNTYSVTPWDPNVNASVTAIAVGCGTVYIGGEFTEAGGQPRRHLAAVDANTGQPLPWNPDANGDVLSLTLAGNILYAGGKFTNVGGRERHFLAALEADTGEATFWNPKADFGVAGLTISGGAVVSGGSLGPGGKLRKNAAAFNARTGQPLDWAPQITGGTPNSGSLIEGVSALTIWKSTVYLGGPFTMVNDQPRNHLAAVDAVSGVLKPWNPDASGIVDTLAVGRDVIYVGGFFTNVAGVTRTNIAALDLITNSATAWNPNANGKVTTIKPSGKVVYVGGLFTEIGGELRRRLAALNDRTGIASGWNPNASDGVSALAILGSRLYAGGGFLTMDEQPRHNIASISRGNGVPSCWDPNARTVTSSGDSAAAVNAIATSGKIIYVGGAFNRIAGQPRNRLAALGTGCPAAATAWDPNADGSVNALAITRNALFAAGEFKTMGGRYRPNFAVFAPEGAPTIVRQPQSTNVFIGESVLLQAEAGGQGRLSYQWQLNGTNIPGATGPMLTLANGQPTDTGDYVLVVANKLGLINSRPATVDVIEPLGIVSGPQSQTVPPGSVITLSVVAVGHPEPIYQWRLNGANIPGAINSIYAITNATPQDGGDYDVVIANNGGATNSEIARIIVTSPPLAFADQFSNAVSLLPSESGVGSGSNAGATTEPGELHAGKAGGSSVWVSWTAPANGVAIFSTRGSTFDTLLGIYTLSGTGLVEVASDEDAGGFYTSQAALNTVAGSNYLIGVDGLGGATGHIVLTWTNEPGVSGVPRFSKQPFDQSVFAGANVTFVSEVLSAVTYQWFRNCDAITGATNATLSLPNVAFDDVGNYRVVAVNASGYVTESSTVSLEIGPEPSAFSHDKLEDLLAAAANEELAPSKSRPKAGATAFVSVPAGTIASQRLNNSRARTQPGEPLICGTLGGASKWFGLRPKADGTIVIDTIGSSIDTLLSAYRRSTLRELQNNRIDCNDNGAPDGLRSLLRLTVTNGQDLLLSVDGVNRQQGAVVLNWSLSAGGAFTSKQGTGEEISRAGTPTRLVSVESRLADGVFRLTVAATGTNRLVLQSSTNLMQWTSIYTNPPYSPPVTFDFPIGGASCNFFRAVP